MDRFMDVEARFLHADMLIERGEIVEAKEVLMEIIEDEPDFGRAHNHLGWLYRARLTDFARAEYHLRLAVKFAPDYPGGYINYGNILMELGEFDKLAQLAAKALNVRGINRAAVIHFMAVVEERNDDISTAIKLLKQAKDEAMDEGMIRFLQSEIRRIKSRVSRFSRIAMLF